MNISIEEGIEMNERTDGRTLSFKWIKNNNNDDDNDDDDNNDDDNDDERNGMEWKERRRSKGKSKS